MSASFCSFFVSQNEEQTKAEAFETPRNSLSAFIILSPREAISKSPGKDGP